MLPSAVKGRAIITLSDNSPFLYEHPYGEGKLLFCAVTPTLEWSDFPLKGIFVPMMNRAVLYLASKHEEGKDFLVGENVLAQIPRASQTVTSSAQFSLKLPDGTEELIKPFSSPSAFGSLMFSVESTDQPGAYQIFGGNQLLKEFVLNVDPRESDLGKIDKSRLEQFWNQFGVQSVTRISTRDEIETVILQSRYGIELWKYALLLALIVAVAEMIIAREGKSQQTSPTLSEAH